MRVGDIEFDHVRIPPGSLDVAAQVFQAVQSPAGQNHGGPRRRERLGELRPQTARGPGDQGHPA